MPACAGRETGPSFPFYFILCIFPPPRRGGNAPRDSLAAFPLDKDLDKWLWDVPAGPALSLALLPTPARGTRLRVPPQSLQPLFPVGRRLRQARPHPGAEVSPFSRSVGCGVPGVMINPEPHGPSAILIRAGMLRPPAPGTHRDPHPGSAPPESPGRALPGWVAPARAWGCVSFPCPRVTDVPRAILGLWPSEGGEGQVSISGFPGDLGSTGVPAVLMGVGSNRAPFLLPLLCSCPSVPGLGLPGSEAGWWLLGSWALSPGPSWGEKLSAPSKPPPKRAGEAELGFFPFPIWVG